MGKHLFVSKNAAQTQKIAAKIAENLLMEKDRKKALVLALEGELGGGKTTFVQGLAKVLGIKERITSPTFVISRRFAITGERFANFYHVDCYRLENQKELLALGLREILKRQENLVVIEWADKVKSLIPKDAVWVKFEWVGEDERKIIFEF
jgi:tRNA threonylcarbamoyladenosine biosynthesis protein TsaE